MASVLSNLGSAISDAFTKFSLPRPNVLSSYASYDYVFGLYCLDPASYNFPNSSYLAGQLPTAILKSAGANPDNRFIIGGTKFEFYMTELTVNSTVSFTPKLTNTSNLTLEFKIVEPYSMCGFPTALSGAAGLAGYQNYNDAVYLITIDFRGNTEGGAISSIPSTSKYIPFKFTKIDMKMTPAGATYDCAGYVANGESLKDEYLALKTNVNFSGLTVQEALQSGAHSLQAALNKYYDNLKKDGGADQPERIYIVFPSTLQTGKSGSQTPNASSKYNVSSATVSKITSGTDASFLKSIGLKTADQQQAIAQQDTSTVNKIGSSEFDGETIKAANKPFAKSVVDPNTGEVNKASTQVVDPKSIEFEFPQGTSIIDMINKVLFVSKYAVNNLKSSAVDADGFRTWWRVDTQVYHINSDDNIKSKGRLPKIVVYRVCEYKSHVAWSLATNVVPPGLDSLRKKVAKVYNYIYTGLNTEILNFNIEIKNAFIMRMAPDLFKNTQSELLQNRNDFASEANKDAKKDEVQVNDNGAKVNKGNVNAAQTLRYTGTETSLGRIGGTYGAAQTAQAAAWYHDVINTPYDMSNANITIMGDPYYISNSGMGNYTANVSSQVNITSDGDMNYQGGEVSFIVNFKSPNDINQSTGLYDFSSNKTAYQWQGLYKLTTVKSTFKDGKFTQVLNGIRLPNQPPPNSVTSSSGLKPGQAIGTDKQSPAAAQPAPGTPEYTAAYNRGDIPQV